MSERVPPPGSPLAGTPSNADDGSGKPPARRRRRKLKWAVAVLILLALLVFCVPYLASTAPGTGLIVSIANSQIPGKLSLQDLSLRWLGSCTLKNAVLKDLQGQEVVRIDSLTYGGGVWNILTSAMNFGELRIETPQVSLYVDRNGRISLVDALVRADTAAEKKAPSSLPAVIGHIQLQNGSLQVFRPDGRRLDVSQITGSFSLNTLDAIDGTLNLQLPAKGEVVTEVKIRNLAASGKLQPFDAAGTLRVSTPNGVSVPELVNFLMEETQSAGKVDVSLDGTVENGTIRLAMKTGATGLQVHRGESGRIEPMDGQVTTTVEATRDSLTGRASLETPAGTGQFDLAYPFTGQPPHTAASQLTSAILSGANDAIPRLTLNGRCHLDLARLAKAVPALLAIRPGVEVTSGTLDINDLAIRGANAPSLAGSVLLKNLVTRANDQAVQWEPASFDLDVLVEPGRGLKVQRGDFMAGFGRLTAGGTASEVHAELQADLTELHRQISQIFDFGQAELAGKLAGNVDLKRAGENRINLTSALTTDGFRYRADQRRLELGKVLLTSTGHLDIAASKLSEMAMEAKADIDGKIIATGTSKSSAADQTYQAELDVTQADLAYIGDILKTLAIVDASSSYGGNATLQVKARRATADAPVTSDGALVLRNVSIGGKPLSTEDVTLRWSEAGAADTGQIKLKTAQLASSFARLSANTVDYRPGKQFQASGNLEGDADLAKLLDVVSRISGQEKPPAIAGRLTLKADCSSTAETVRLTGNMTIDGLEVGAGNKRVREDQMRLAVDSAIQQTQDTLTITQCTLDSRLLTLKLGGKITEFSAARRLALNGEYSGSWDTITALLHELAPATADTIAIAGSTGSRFEIIGSAYQPNVRPVFQDVTAGLGIGWDSAAVYGLNLSKATLTPTLKGGQLDLPIAIIPATGGGQVRLGGRVDFSPADPTLLIRDRLQIMENIPITPELGKQLLSRVNPIFGNLTRADGKAGLVVQGVELPLGEAIKQRGAGQGRLDLRDLKIAPGGFMAEAMALGNLPRQELYTVKVEGVDFTLRNGRISYDNFAFIFAGDFDLRFRGSVGFDDTLDLMMSVPVHAALLERCGIRGPFAEYARLLAGTRVEVPVVGTRLQPKLDLAKVDLKPLVDRAIRDAAAGKAGDILKNLPGLGQPVQPRPGAQPSTPAKPDQPPAAKSALDLLDRGLKGAASKPADTRKRR